MRFLQIIGHLIEGLLRYDHNNQLAPGVAERWENTGTEVTFWLRDDALWQFEMRFPSGEDWTEFLEKPSCGGVDADRELLEEAFSRPGGCIVLTEENVARVYERLAR